MRYVFHGLLLFLLCSAGPARAALINTGNSTDTANNATQISLSLPATLQAGDLLIAQIAYRNTGATLTVPNARWSLLQDTANGTNIRQRIYVRTVVVADVAGSSETWSLSSSTRMAGGLSGWRSSVAAVYPGIEQSRSDTGTSSGAGNNITAPGITAVNSGQLLRLFGLGYGNGFASTPPGLSEYYLPETSAGPNGASLLGVGRAISLPGSTGSDTVSANGPGSYIVHTLFLYEPVSTVPRLSWWLDESAWSGSAGEILDQSGNGLHGTAFNGANTAFSNPGPALPTNSSNLGTCRYGAFNAAANQTRYAQVADSNLLDLASFTVSLWVYPTSYPGSGLMSILSKDENYEFHLKPSGVINWWWQDGTGTREFDSVSALPLNSWSHVAIRFDDAGNTQRIYLNGLPDASASFTGTPRTNNDPLQIGTDQGVAGRYFRGNLDEVRVHAGALSDAQIAALAAERHPCAGAAGPHHLEFLHDGSALTCQPETVTLRACADASCSSLYTGSVTATLTPSGWVGGDSLTFTGSTTAKLRYISVGAVTLGTATVTPTPISGRVCNSATSGSCVLSFADSGFFFDVPNLLANKPSGVLDLVAAKKSDSGDRCVPAFASGPRTVQFWSTYSNPATGTLPVSVNGTAIGGGSPGTALSLNFDANARASIEVHYADAGQMTLNASYTGSVANGDAGLLMTGADQFVARPAGYCVYSDSANSDCASGDASCSAFVAAGDRFRLRVKAAAWQSDVDTALCTGNGTTPNYQQSGIFLVPALVAPSGGVNAVLGVNGVDIAAADLGEKVLTDQTVSEVGVFSIEAQAGSYLGGPPVGDSDGDGTVEATEASLRRSANIGRFYPASFLLSDPILTPACSTGFTYAGLAAQVGPPAQEVKTGQVFGFRGALSARNVGGVVTRNYTGSFAMLTAADISYADSAVVSAGTVSASTYLTAGTSTTGTCSPGPDCRGYIDYSTKNPLPAPSGTDTATFLMNSAIAPYNLTIRTTATDSDGVTGSVTDILSGSPLPDFRLGQARIGNAHGSELQDLSLPFTAAYFNGSGYAPNPLDSCTVFKPASLGAYQRTDTGSGSPVLVDLPYQAAAGAGSFLLSAPGANSSGSALLTYDAPDWLDFDWNGDGVLNNPSGLATFGIYKGAAPLIYRRELYRQ